MGQPVKDLTETQVFDALTNKLIVQLTTGTKIMGINAFANAFVKALTELKEADNAAGIRNGMYRGKKLGEEFTAEQSATIQAGVFDDMFIGDYWEIGGFKWRIAHFDYWLNTGSDGNVCSTHHVVIVPDECLYNAQMNSTNVVTGGYIGSAMYTSGLNSAKTTVQTAFGSSHILKHKAYFTNAVSSNTASGWAEVDSTVDLMNEWQVYGGPACTNCATGYYIYEVGYDKTQFALFALRPDLITNRSGWWLRGVSNSATFCNVGAYGIAANNSASNSIGVRPAFAIC